MHSAFNDINCFIWCINFSSASFTPPFLILGFHLEKLLPSYVASSLPVVVASLTKDMQIEQFLCWSGMIDTEHSTTSGSNEEFPLKWRKFLEGFRFSTFPDILKFLENLEISRHLEISSWNFSEIFPEIVPIFDFNKLFVFQIPSNF